MLSWVKLPVQWIRDHSLTEFRWAKGKGSKETAALMVLTVIAHHAPEGTAKLSYDALTEKLGISRAMVAAGLSILVSRGIVSRGKKQSIYVLNDYTANANWGKLPAKAHYSGGLLQPFQSFKLRSKVELDALKLYFLFVAMRDNDLNSAQISYDKIVEWAGVRREAVLAAVSLLVVNNLVRVESAVSATARTSRGEAVAFNRYRLTHLDSYNHAGTTGRAVLEDF
jgi:DNA-binding transcriptional regulator YhcF (GntR family)